jgi:hypothetical protein
MSGAYSMLEEHLCEASACCFMLGPRQQRLQSARALPLRYATEYGLYLNHTDPI